MKDKSSEYWANREGEEHARHVMGAVPIILEAAVVMVVICIGGGVLWLVFH